MLNGFSRLKYEGARACQKNVHIKKRDVNSNTRKVAFPEENAV